MGSGPGLHVQGCESLGRLPKPQASETVAHSPAPSAGPTACPCAHTSALRLFSLQSVDCGLWPSRAGPAAQPVSRWASSPCFPLGSGKGWCFDDLFPQSTDKGSRAFGAHTEPLLPQVALPVMEQEAVRGGRPLLPPGGPVAYCWDGGLVTGECMCVFTVCTCVHCVRVCACVNVCACVCALCVHVCALCVRVCVSRRKG